MTLLWRDGEDGGFFGCGEPLGLQIVAAISFGLLWGDIEMIWPVTGDGGPVLQGRIMRGA